MLSKSTNHLIEMAIRPQTIGKTRKKRELYLAELNVFCIFVADMLPRVPEELVGLSGGGIDRYGHRG